MKLQVQQSDADLIVFPELNLTGYFFASKKEIAPLAESTDGPLSHAIAKLAKETHKAIITGFLERDGEHYYNSALAFDCNGALVGLYRKVHLFYYETQIFEPGNLGFPVFEIKTNAGIASTGIMICYDWRFPEAARSLAIKGAELIAVPSNIVTTTGMLLKTLQTRAFENKVVLAFADRIGSEENAFVTPSELTFRGESTIINFNGEILSQADSTGEQILVSQVNLDPTREKSFNNFNNLLKDRRPETY